jgi:nucleoid DNA-binding protein
LEIALGLGSLQQWMAQVPAINERINTPEEVALLSSGPQFFVTLIAGVILAFAFQLLLTNLSVALGISVLGRSSDSEEQHHDSSGDSLGGTIKKIGTAVGIWTLVTVSIALFIACLLAVKLSLTTSALFGAILGVVIWAAYFCILVFFSSTTVGSLIGSVVNTATSGFQTILGTATAALGARAVNNQVVATAEAAAAAVKRELGSGLDPASIRESIEDYLDTLRPPELDYNRIRGEFEKLVNDPELRSLAGNGSPADVIDRLRNVDRNTFLNLISNRTDLSKRDANRLVDQLDNIWQQVVNQHQRKDPTAELLDYLKTVQPNAIDSNEFRTKLDQLTEEVRRQRELLQQPQAGQTSLLRSAGMDKAEPSLIDRAMQYGVSTIIGTVMGRNDLSDLSVEKILDQLQILKDKTVDTTKQVTGQVAEKAPGSPFNTIKADVENYLLNSYTWHFNRVTLESEFKDVLYDPQADPATVRRMLEQIDRSYFVDVLNRRGDLVQPRITEIADNLETIRTSVLSTVKTAENQEGVQTLRQEVEHYLRSVPREELTAETIDRDFTRLLHDTDVDYEVLRDRFGPLDRTTLLAILAQRQDVTPEEADRIVGQLESIRDRVLSESQSAQETAKNTALELRGRVENYLRNTHKDELNPEAIEREFRLLLDDPQAGAAALRSRLSQFDRNTLIALLSQRQDITPEEADRIISQLERVRDSVMNAPRAVVGKAKEQYDQTTMAIADYLRQTNLPELDPQGIQRDLQLLIQNPQAGGYALRARLSQMDRRTLVTLLSQRGDLTEEQVNRAIDQFQEAARNVVRAPRRLAARTQAQVQDFQTALSNYLRNTNKEELNPEGIQRDLQLLFSDPRSGFGNLRDRLSHVDRSTIVALLAQRQDMTEEEANRIVDQVLSVREQVMAQIQKVQNRIQSVIDSILARIRDYLNSLDRPELNYEGIRRDIRTLFADPKAGFEALRDRLGSFNRDTLVAVLSSREDISADDVNRIIDQVESARDSVLRRAERIQAETQRRLEEVKYQAQKQMRETRKAAESAAWWLFGTALVSGIVSAIAGALAVS